MDWFIVDGHIHTYPTAEMGLRDLRALGAEESAAGHNGSIEDVLAAMKEDNVSISVMQNWLPVASMKDAALQKLPFGLKDYRAAEKEIDATLADRLERRNIWTCEVAKKHPNLVPFISIDPVMGSERMAKEIHDKVANHGAKGLKIEGGMQRFFPHDRRLWPAYEALQELDLPLLAHSGWSPDSPTEFTEPKYFGEVLSHFPKLRLVLAHLGAPFYEQTKALAKSFPDVNFDCSYVINPEKTDLSNSELVSLFREVGVNRIIFGTDFPFGNRPKLLQRMFELELTDEEKRLLLSENAIRIYKLEDKPALGSKSSK